MTKIKILLSVYLFTLTAKGLVAQVSLFSYEHYVNGAGDTLQYRQLLSDYDPVSKYPLLIFLHGMGEWGDDNESQLKWGVMNFATAEVMKTYRPIVIAPQLRVDQDWDSFSGENLNYKNEPRKPMKMLRELIDQKIAELPIDTNRIYITGLSMGGFGTYDAIMRYPDLFAAAVPVCGGGDVKKAKDIAHIPIWIFQGALDDVVPPQNSLKMVEALMYEGAHPGYTLLPETGHFSWLAAYSDSMMIDWLFSQRKH
jgi:predicted peptidase